jgi:hypothetical protein
MGCDSPPPVAFFFSVLDNEFDDVGGRWNNDSDDVDVDGGRTNDSEDVDGSGGRVEADVDTVTAGADGSVQRPVVTSPADGTLDRGEPVIYGHDGSQRSGLCKVNTDWVLKGEKGEKGEQGVRSQMSERMVLSYRISNSDSDSSTISKGCRVIEQPDHVTKKHLFSNEMNE